MIGSVLMVRYELTGALADGPIFTTYSARDRTVGKEVCVRLLKPPFNHEPAFVEQLRRAVKKYALVQGPGIEALSDVGEQDGTVFIVGDLTRGPNLSDRIRKLAPFSVPVSVGMAISICQGLDALHRANLAHGDVSSPNVVVLGDGEARLQMSGIWEAYSGSPTAGSLALPGMAPYLAPEVSAGEEPSLRSDVYAVGVILFELLTGRHPYIADTALATAMKHRTQQTPSVRAINPSVPEVLDEIIKKAMDKEPSLRYRNAAEMLADLRLLQDALRFGRSLSWPLRADGKRVRVVEPQPVAPRMSAIRTQDEVEELPKRARQDRDVPVWMLVVMTALGAVLLSLLGMWAVFNISKPKLVPVPNIKGLTVDEARGMLQTEKLELRVGQRLADEKVPADHIIDVNPPPGGKVREGGQVFATISLGSRYMEMPDVRGLTVDKAESVLQNLGLDVEKPEQKVASSAVPIGSVARQYPAPRQRVERMDHIRLYVSTGPPPGGQPDETMTSNPPEFQYTVRMTVSRVPQPVIVRIDMVDPESPDGRTILSEQHSAGDLVEVTAQSSAPEATFVIYYDDVVVKRVQQTAEGAKRQ